MTMKSSFRHAGFTDASETARRLSRQRAHRLSIQLTAGTLLLAVAGSWSGAEAQSTKGKVVGLGAATCQRFKDDVKSNAILRRDYMAWAQGFMSGMLASQPGGADEQINLNPVTYDLVSQVHFLEDHCSQNSALRFSEAVAALFQRLLKESKT